MKRIHRALITGITGQDGRYLTDRLLQDGASVVGLTRSAGGAAVFEKEYSNKVSLEITDYSAKNIESLIAKHQPEVIFHMAGQTYVGKSWVLLHETILGCMSITASFLDVLSRKYPKVRFFNASSSEIYSPSDLPMDESFQKEPTTPYGCSKLFAHNIAQAYRQNFDLFVSNGILFNHESARRASDFFSKKLVLGVADILQGKQDVLLLGNLEIERDWGFAQEYMDAVVELMLFDQPSDFNICSGRGVMVKSLVEQLMNVAGLDYSKHVRIDGGLVRNREKKRVIGNGAKLTVATGWQARTKIEDVLKEMLRMELTQRGVNAVL